MRRREFITLVGGAAAWPVVGRAQQSSKPVIGFLQSASLDGGMVELLRGFHQGLKDTGFIEGENVAIDYRFADNDLERLPALAADLVRGRVAIIVAGSPP